MSERDLEHTPRNCWETYASVRHRAAMDRTAARFVEFLSDCKTERETAAWVLDKARQAGFSEKASGGAYVRVFRNKAVLLARKGRRALKDGLRILAAHGDSPRLDLKQHPLYEECDLALAKTHYYGGIRKYQWLARPLALHGVVVKADGTVVQVRLGEDPADPVLAISDLLPHLAAKQNEQKISEAFEAEKLNLLLGNEPQAGGKAGKNDNRRLKKRVLGYLSERYGIVEADLYSAELQAVPAGPARLVGLDGSLIGGYGQDDRLCVFCALEALLKTKDPETTSVVVVWDKEEIGSDGATGAKSMFFENTLEDLVAAWEPEARLRHVLEASKAISADVHAPMEPDYQSLYEKLNSSRMGFGPVLCKFTGHRGKYGANDAHAEYVGWLRGVLDRAGVPWQMAELGRVDAGGGGTVAKHLAAYGLDTIDCGPSVLGIHSPFEMSSKADVYATTLAFQAFLAS